MKKLLSTLVILAMMIVSITPINIKAQSKPSIELKEAIELAKKSLNIKTEGYDFSYNYNENDKNTWELRWNSKGEASGEISVSVDADNGDILRMNIWDNNAEKASKIPKYTKDQCIKAAEGFIKKLQPENSKYVKLYANIYNNSPSYDLYSTTYDFRFVRYIDGIPFPDNCMNVTINKNTLKVIGYNYSWDKSNIPDASKAKNIDDAKKIFENKIGLELTYQVIYNYQKNERKPILTYSLKGQNNPIDALTGEVINNFGPFYGENMKKTKSMQDQGAAPLTPEEQASVDTNNKYISKDQAIEVAQKYLPLTDKYKLTNANLYVNKIDNTASWHLAWNYRDETNKIYNYLSASINAVNSEVNSFSISADNPTQNQEVKPVYSKEQAKKISDDFIKSIQPEKYASIEYREYGNNVYPRYEDPNGYYFSYIRKYNNISCPFNSFMVYVDSYTGKITNYNMSWTDIELPAADNVIGLDKAYSTLYNKCDFSLRYMRVYNQQEDNKLDIKLAYYLDRFNGYIDAKTGTLLDYSGNPVKEVKSISYSDIKNNPAENNIKLLIEMGIIDLPGDKFMPNNRISQQDFIRMLVRALEPVYDDNSNSNDYDKYYKVALQRNILTQKEVNRTAPVTRQDAAKFIIKSLNLGYVADLSDIYNLSFKDSKAISKGNKGYAALSSALKIVPPIKGYFCPTKDLTRGDAATIIVNYLKSTSN